MSSMNAAAKPAVISSIGTPAALGGCVDLVVDVGDVAGVDDTGIQAPQQFRQQAEDDVRPRVADVNVVVNGRSAHIQRHPARILGNEILDAAGQAVVQAKGHRYGLVLCNSIAGGRARTALARAGFLQ